MIDRLPLKYYEKKNYFYLCSAKGNRTPVLRMRILRPNP